MSKLSYLKLVWKNYGQIKFGEDIANITLEFKKEASSLFVSIDYGRYR